MSKSESRFFADKAQDIRNFEAAAVPGSPGWPILAPAALFLCHAPSLNYKLTGYVAVTGGKPRFRERHDGGHLGGRLSNPMAAATGRPITLNLELMTFLILSL
jgi:hypothetical protein